MAKTPKDRPDHGESNDGVFLLLLQSRKLVVAIPRLVLQKKNKNTPSFDSPWFGLSCGPFAIVYSSLVTLLWLIHRDSRNLRELTRRRPCKYRTSKSRTTT